MAYLLQKRKKCYFKVEYMGIQALFNHILVFNSRQPVEHELWGRVMGIDRIS